MKTRYKRHVGKVCINLSFKPKTFEINKTSIEETKEVKASGKYEGDLLLISSLVCLQTVSLQPLDKNCAVVSVQVCHNGYLRV